MFSSQSINTVTNLQIALANTKKLQISIAAFLTKMQGLVDELATAEDPIMDQELRSDDCADGFKRRGGRDPAQVLWTSEAVDHSGPGARGHPTGIPSFKLGEPAGT
jgi:hypothetical protein